MHMIILQVRYLVMFVWELHMYIVYVYYACISSHAIFMCTWIL